MSRETLWLTVFIVASLATTGLLVHALLGADPDRKVHGAAWTALAATAAVMALSGVLMFAADGT